MAMHEPIKRRINGESDSAAEAASMQHHQALLLIARFMYGERLAGVCFVR